MYSQLQADVSTAFQGPRAKVRLTVGKLELGLGSEYL